MCDTIVATPAYTKNGKMLFAKNSDRSPNEPQFLQHIPAKDYDLQKNADTCAYIRYCAAGRTYL